MLEKIDPATQKDYWVARLSIDGKVITEDVLVFETLGELKNVVKISVPAIGMPFIFDTLFQCSQTISERVWMVLLSPRSPFNYYHFTLLFL